MRNPIVKLAALLAALLVFLSAAPAMAACPINQDGYYKNIRLYGKVKVVNSFPDIKVQIVNSFPDLKVQIVNSFPDSIGKWQFVDSGEDFKVQFVNSFPDIKIQYVNSFPGLP